MYELAFAQDTDTSIRRLIDGDGKLDKLKTILDDILNWLHTLQPNSKKGVPFSKRLLWSSSTQHKRIKMFSDELEKYKLTAALVLNIASR